MPMIAMFDTGEILPLAAILIPLAAVVMGFAIPLFWIYTDFRKRRDIFEMHHRERMAAIEKGIPVPPLPEGIFEDLSKRGRKPCTPASTLLKGLVWLFLGTSIAIAVWAIRHDARAFLGLIPAGIGAAYLIFYAVEGRKKAAPSIIQEQP